MKKTFIFTSLLLSLIPSAFAKETSISDGVFDKSTSTSQANDATIHFVGRFYETPCTVTIDGEKNPTINLGRYASSNFTTAGQQTSLRAITFQLSNCPTTTKDNDKYVAHILFKGEKFKEKLFKVSEAKNVGIRIYTDSNTDLNNAIDPNNTYWDLDYTKGSTVNKYIYAHYVTTGAVESGEANADVNIEISYN